MVKELKTFSQLEFNKIHPLEVNTCVLLDAAKYPTILTYLIIFLSKIPVHIIDYTDHNSGNVILC